jgi:gluconokinase
MLESQLATLEPLAPDEPGVTLDATQDIETLVQQALTALQAPAQR